MCIGVAALLCGVTVPVLATAPSEMYLWCTVFWIRQAWSQYLGKVAENLKPFKEKLQGQNTWFGWFAIFYLLHVRELLFSQEFVKLKTTVNDRKQVFASVLIFIRELVQTGHSDRTTPLKEQQGLRSVKNIHTVARRLGEVTSMPRIQSYEDVTLSCLPCFVAMECKRSQIRKSSVPPELMRTHSERDFWRSSLQCRNGARFGDNRRGCAGAGCGDFPSCILWQATIAPINSICTGQQLWQKVNNTKSTCNISLLVLTSVGVYMFGEWGLGRSVQTAESPNTIEILEKLKFWKGLIFYPSSFNRVSKSQTQNTHLKLAHHKSSKNNRYFNWVWISQEYNIHETDDLIKTRLAKKQGTFSVLINVRRRKPQGTSLHGRALRRPATQTDTGWTGANSTRAS